MRAQGLGWKVLSWKTLGFSVVGVGLMGAIGWQLVPQQLQAASEPSPPEITAVLPPAPPLQLAVTPEQLQLGETLRVEIIVPDSAPSPTVAWGGEPYPVFLLATTPEQRRYRALLPTSPLFTPGNFPLTVTTGETEVTRSIPLGDRQFPLQSITLRGGGGLQATAKELEEVQAFKEIISPEKLWQGAMLAPSQGPVSSIYGVRRTYNGVFAEDYYHRGVDYAAPTGAPIIAPASGRVALIGRHGDGYAVHGNTIGLDHGQGITSIFLHLSQIEVEMGQMVNAGELIGRIGTTGASTGPHLHWGLYVHGIAVDPVPWRFGAID